MIGDIAIAAEHQETMFEGAVLELRLHSMQKIVPDDGGEPQFRFMESVTNARHVTLVTGSALVLSLTA